MKTLALAIALLATPLAAQVPAPSAASLARDIVVAAYALPDAKAAALAKFESSFGEGFKRNPQGAQLAAQRPDLFAAGLTAGKTEFARQYDLLVVPAMSAAIAEVYAANFTAAELEQIRRYHTSPEARRFQDSFGTTLSAPEIAQAKADPVVVRYRSSKIGLKETALSGAIATAMAGAVTSANERVVPLVNARIVEAIRAAAAQPQR